jgi:hypothetical protein
LLLSQPQNQPESFPVGFVRLSVIPFVVPKSAQTIALCCKLESNISFSSPRLSFTLFCSNRCRSVIETLSMKLAGILMKSGSNKPSVPSSRFDFQKRPPYLDRLVGKKTFSSCDFTFQPFQQPLHSRHVSLRFITDYGKFWMPVLVAVLSCCLHLIQGSP